MKITKEQWKSVEQNLIISYDKVCNKFDIDLRLTKEEMIRKGFMEAFEIECPCWAYESKDCCRLLTCSFHNK
jgi:hypothetical protein